MDKEQIGILAGILVWISIIPYSIRTFQGKVKPNPTSWSLWTFIALALLLTYNDSGATDNVWPAIFGFTNPLLIVIILIWRQRTRWKKFSRTETICLYIGIISLLFWIVIKIVYGENENIMQYALYVGIAADVCAAIPTIIFLWQFPLEDRPLAWGLYAIGYGLGIFAINDHTFANYILPIYMFLGATFITLPLIIYRVRIGAPLKEWI